MNKIVVVFQQYNRGLTQMFFTYLISELHWIKGIDARRDTGKSWVKGERESFLALLQTTCRPLKHLHDSSNKVG